MLHMTDEKEWKRRMEATSFHFFLTGSRYFGNAQLNSDWDFFCLDSQDVRGWLESIGFNREKYNQSYNDSNCLAVYYGRFEGDSVHVQLVKNESRKCWAQNLIKNLGLFNGQSKAEQKRIWDIVLVSKEF